MASPFNLFRKNQRIMMTVIGVGCMVGFLLGGMGIIENMRPGQGGSDEEMVVVSWNGGQLTQRDIDQLKGQRNLAVDYLVAIARQAIKNGGTPKGPGVQVNPRSNEVTSVGIPPAKSNSAIIQSQLLAEKAENMGFTVTDGDIKKFILGVSDESISNDDLAAILKRVGGNRMADTQLFDTLRRELLAQKLLLLGQSSGMMSSTPGEMWHYHNQLNRQITAEVIALPISEFIDKVEEPSTAQLRAFYDQYKNQLSHPLSPEPGFHTRQKKAFGYFQASMNDFMEGPDGELAKVTQEEIEAYYEANKDTMFRQRELPQFDEEGPGLVPPATEAEATPGETTEERATEPAPDAPTPEGNPELTPPDNSEPEQTPPAENPAESPAQESPAQENPAEQTPTDDQPIEEQPAQPVEPTPESDTPTEEPATEEPAVEEVPAEETPAEEAPTEEAPTEEAPTEEAPIEEAPAAEAPADESSALPLGNGRTVASFVSYQEPSAEAAADDEQADDEQAPAPQPEPAGQEATEKEATVEEVPAEANATDSQPSGEVTPPSEPPSGSETPADEGTQPPTDPNIEAPSTAPKYSPLEKEEAGIRSKIATPRAFERMNEALRSAQRELASYATLAADIHTLSQPTFDDNKQTQEELKQKRAKLKSNKPNYQAIANKLGLTYVQIPLSNQFEVQEYPLGRFSYTDSQTGEQITFPRLAYGEQMPYQPKLLGDQQQRDDQFLYWVTESQAPRVPSFEELYNEKSKSGPLLKAWNKQQALPKAKQRAAELADKSNKTEKMLHEQFGEQDGITVNLTNQFSWFTSGGFQNNFQPSLSQVTSVESRGNEFMEAVFALNVGEAGVAVNQPHTVVYVVHVIEQSPSTEALRSMFANPGNMAAGSRDQNELIRQITTSRNTMQIAQNDRQRAYQDWFDDVERELDVKYMR